MTEDAQGSSRVLLVAVLGAAVAFLYFEHTTWVVLAVLVLLGYCTRAYVHQSQPEIAQLQMHDMVDHTALHPQSKADSTADSATKAGSFSPDSQQSDASAQPAEAGTSIHRPQDTATAKMPADNISSERFAGDSSHDKPDLSVPDFTFSNVSPQARPPAIQPMQPMQHMDPMQEAPAPSQTSSYNYEAPHVVAPQVINPGVRTISQTKSSQVSDSSESYTRSGANQPPVQQYQASGTHQEGWASEVGDGITVASDAGSSRTMYGQPAPAASGVPLLPDGFAMSSDAR